MFSFHQSESRSFAAILSFSGLILLFAAACQPAEPDGETAVDDLRNMAPITEIRPLDPEIWSRRAVCYSGFREGQSPETGVYPSREEILEDLRLLADEGFGLIRVFSSGTHGRRVVGLIAEHGLDLKVQMGAYVSGSDADNNREANLRELDGAIKLANDYPDVVAAVSVGNEVLVSWSFVPVPPRELAAHIRYVRERVSHPVTFNDNWEPYAADPDSEVSRVRGQVDFASVHTYPFWDAAFNLWDFKQEDVPTEQRARAMMEAAAAYARKNFEEVRRALDEAGYAIPIVIGETGWQSHPAAFLHEAFEPDFAKHQAHPVNQRWYFEAMTEWAYGPDGSEPGDGFSRPAALFFFSAFDEPWKQADDHWGLWTADREPKHTLTGEGHDPAEAVHFR